MKKRNLLLVVILFLVYTVQAQKARTFLTLHGGFASAQGTDAKLASGAGLDFEFPLSEKAFFAVKPTINSRGYNSNLYVNTVKATYFDLPALLEFAFDESSNHFYGGFGAYAGFGLSGKYKSNISNTANSEWQKFKWGEDSASNRSRTDFGLAFDFGANWELGKKSIKFGVQPLFGLKNVVPKDRQDEANASPIRLRYISLYLSLGLSKN